MDYVVANHEEIAKAAQIVPGRPSSREDQDGARR